MMHLLNLSSDDMEALVEHREKLDAELEQLRETRMELEAEIEGNGGKDVVLVAVSSLSKQARNAWKERAKLKELSGTISLEGEAQPEPEAPWYVEADVDWYIENYREQWYNYYAGDNSKVVMRKENIRNAFNSPMRPFVLATTSIGQEGLDFHNYCRVIMHWNLPSNPIDVGRILRTFKIKKNVEVTDNGKIII